MTVRLAPIRPHDLRAGDVLIDVKGVRWKLRYRNTWLGQAGWAAYNTPAIWKHRFIADVDIERTGPHRHWWLDSTVDRP